MIPKNSTIFVYCQFVTTCRVLTSRCIGSNVKGTKCVAQKTGYEVTN